MRALVAALVALALPAAAAAVEPGDVVIAELMIRSQSAPEWIELANVTGAPVDLAGCTLADAGASEELDGLIVPAGGLAVVADDAPCVAFDAGGACVRPADLVISLLTLNDTGSETLELRCGGELIDAVVYAWDGLSDGCDEANRTCSASLAPLSIDAAANDAWPDAWCVSPASEFVHDALGREMRATPGAPNVCPDAADACGPGDAVVTELMVAPPTSTREWFEVKVLAEGGCDLHGCTLAEGPFSDPLASPTSPDWQRHVVQAGGNTLHIAAGAYALFAKGADTVVGDPLDPDETDLVDADYRYATLTFGNADPGYLHLLCGGEPIDSVPYDWTVFAPACPAGGCSVNVPPSREDAAANDSLASFCLPPDAPTRPSSTGLPMTGTPGAPGACQQREWPQAGALLITELMIAPLSGSGRALPEWFELTNVGDAEVDTTGCRLTRARLDAASGTYLPTSTSSASVFGAEAEAALVPPGASLVWSRSSCIDGADPAVGPCVGGERIYTGVELSNSEDERLELRCPDGDGGERVVARAGYNLVETGIRTGRSVQLDPTDADAVSTSEDPSSWCEAAVQECYVTNADGVCNFGTPGAAGPCATGQVASPPSGTPGCRCDATAPVGVGGLAALGAALLLPRRRR